MAAEQIAPVLETALRARDAGISVMPIAEDGTKKPALGTWKHHMRSIPCEDEIRYRFAESTGIAFVCGRVSGGLECLDFDRVDAFDSFRELCHESGLGELVERVIAGYHERSPRGIHLLYRCSAPTTTKLARRREVGEAKPKAIIETKGEGGYVIVAPSHGDVHPDGIYELVRGSIEEIVELSDEERAALHGVARALDEAIEPQHAEPELEPATEHGARPGDEWARMTAWSEILEPHGWARLWTRGDITYWRRPGKDRGISATTNYAGSDLLYVFSTNTDFEANRGYGKFGAYALLEHRGDFGAAARCLHDQGFGQPHRPAIEGVDLSALLALPKPPPAPQDGSFPEHLFDVPGLVGELYRYLYERASHPQRVLSLASAIASMGALFGRRVVMRGVRPNIAVIGLAETASGKEWTRSGARRVFREANLEELLSVDSVTSGSAIHAILRRTPSVLLSFDEWGRMISMIKKWDAHGVIEELMAVYGRSGDVSWSKSYAASRRGNDDGAATRVWYPHLSIYATSVPGRFWDSLDSEDALDGFLNRFLIFPSENPNPYPQHRSQAVPMSLVERIGEWHPMHDLAYQASLGDPDNPPPPAHELELALDAQRLVQSLTDELHQRVDKAYAAGEASRAAALKRTREHALKLAIIRAAGRMAPGRWGTVDADDVQWGAELALWCSEYALTRVERTVGASEHDRDCKRVLEWIESQGGAVKRSQVTARWQRIKTLRDVVQTLLDSEQLAEVRAKSTGGRPARWLCTAEAARRMEKPEACA